MLFTSRVEVVSVSAAAFATILPIVVDPVKQTGVRKDRCLWGRTVTPRLLEEVGRFVGAAQYDFVRLWVKVLGQQLCKKGRGTRYVLGRLLSDFCMQPVKASPTLIKAGQPAAIAPTRGMRANCQGKFFH